MHILKRVAKAAHEINRAYCAALGDHSQAPWEDTPEAIQQSALAGVRFHIANPGASADQSHENWYAHKKAEGWTYGPEKDLEKKTHPCMVPFGQLPIEQQAKDYIFQAVVRQCLDTILAGEK